MIRRNRAIRVLTLMAVTLVGAGACASDPQGGQGGAGALPPASTADSGTGAGAPPEPDQQPSSTAPTAPTTTTPPVTQTTKPPAKEKPSGCETGERQRQVEGYLAKLGGFGAVTVDGKQSAADCSAIKKFQQRYGIKPAEGRAGPTTENVAKRLAGTNVASCEAKTQTTFCVDLTRQTAWVMRGKTVVVPPTVVRTGMAGHATATGWYSINRRNIKEWSNPYEVWLPYWQHFTQGMGFHQTTTYIHNSSIGSQGCVNLLLTDAKKFWSIGKMGDRVHVFGRRSGT